MASYEALYTGSSTLSPSYYSPPTSYQPSTGDIGMALDARTANQLGDLNIKLNPGQKVVEIQGIQGRTMESIPDQHLDEIHRLTKLAGVKPTLHGPMVNASGVEQQGGFTEENRVGVENQIESTILRAHKLDPKGNVNVTFHSTAGLPEFQPHTIEDGKRVEKGLMIIDESTGQIRPIADEQRYLGEEGKFTGERIDYDPKAELEKINKDTWLSQLSRLNNTANFGEGALNRINIGGKIVNDKEIPKIQQWDVDLVKDSEDKKEIRDAQREIDYGHVYMKETYRGMRDLFDKAWLASKREGNKEDMETLKKFAKYAEGTIKKDFENDPNQINKLREVVNNGLRSLALVKSAPATFRPLNDFAIEKSAETFANVAQKAYKEYGNTAPIISIENPPGGEGLSTGEDLKNLIEASRKKLTENLHKSGMSQSQAKGVAANMIGATWDVGHINMMRKKGYSEKDVIAETKKVAPFVKHVHLSDNFGLDHTELPMGMGNVPLKPMMDEIKKTGFKGSQIVEAGNWWEFFSTQGGGNPFKPSIEGMDSPIYAMDQAPGWANTGAYGNYFSGQGPISPSVHHNLYGAGFQNLPVELGGEIAGDRGRFAGTPNQ
ncbi:hypothetical protein CMI42_01470 [Candidatus Pacearchaeota archaeon]|nr:hypothetical protein [Candidatus Pacearchaeota archaeon]